MRCGQRPLRGVEALHAAGGLAPEGMWCNAGGHFLSLCDRQAEVASCVMSWKVVLPGLVLRSLMELRVALLTSCAHLCKLQVCFVVRESHLCE